MTWYKCKSIEEDTGILNNLTMVDESWVFISNSETKQQSSEWHNAVKPCPKKAEMSKSRVKAMLIVFCGTKGVVYHKFVPEGQTVSGAF